MTDSSGRIGPGSAGLLRTPLIVGVIVGLVALALASGLAPTTPSGPQELAPATTSDISVQATSSLAFVPDVLDVVPGALVQLVVIQEASIPHTFVLSPVANFTIPANDTPAQLFAFFDAHPPLVNLSLPGTPGARAYANFTAPSVGTYEFVCEIPGHFQSGMHGTLVSSVAAPSGGSSTLLTPTVLIVLGAVVVVVGVGSGLAIWRRSRRSPK